MWQCGNQLQRLVSANGLSPQFPHVPQLEVPIPSSSQLPSFAVSNRHRRRGATSTVSRSLLPIRKPGQAPRRREPVPVFG